MPVDRDLLASMQEMKGQFLLLEARQDQLHDKADKLLETVHGTGGPGSLVVRQTRAEDLLTSLEKRITVLEAEVVGNRVSKHGTFNALIAGVCAIAAATITAVVAYLCRGHK